jgi:hypothetical protein
LDSLKGLKTVRHFTIFETHELCHVIKAEIIKHSAKELLLNEFNGARCISVHFQFLPFISFSVHLQTSTAPS